MEPTFALFDFDRPRPLEILFIGNSYTYYHEMPLIVAGLAEAAGGPKIEAKFVPESVSVWRSCSWALGAQWDSFEGIENGRRLPREAGGSKP